MISVEVQTIELGVPGAVLSGFVCEAGDADFADHLHDHGAVGGAIARTLLQMSPILAVITSIFVEKNQRRRGFGNRLMGQFMDEVESIGATAIVITIPAEDNDDEALELTYWLASFDFAKVADVDDGSIFISPASIAEAVEDDQ